METLGMKDLFKGIYSGQKVLLTGHTGFKGSWLALWLSRLGAQVIGYARAPETEPNHFSMLDVECESHTGDVCNAGALETIIQEKEPVIVFHLAAQALVRRSYQQPVDTFSSNVMGVVNVLEACRKTPSVKSVVVVTSDKCYENREWIWSYREMDRLGGHDPYSASKACAELVVTSYRRSFCEGESIPQTHHALIATARAGNVIGGGDWAEDRLIPDIVKAIERNDVTLIRYPNATRPWQHVLECLSGYLLLGQKLLEGNVAYAKAWNFGPAVEEGVSVKTVVEQLKRCWPRVAYRIEDRKQVYEAQHLTLDVTQARYELRWHPVWNTSQAFEKTAVWYASYYDLNQILSHSQLDEYVSQARKNQVSWTQA